MDQMVYTNNCSVAISGLLSGSCDGTAVSSPTHVNILCYDIMVFGYRTVQYEETQQPTKEKWITDHTNPYHMTDMVSDGKVYKYHW